MTSAAPIESAAYIENEVFEPVIISSTNTCSERGEPAPPHSGSAESCFQPASYRLFQAALKPVGVMSWPSTILQPSSSPIALSGPVTSRTQR